MDPGKDNSNKTDVNTGGGAFTSGNIDAGGDFVGRDNIHGDVVKGNKIIIQNTLSSAQPSPTWRRAITINTVLIGIVTFLGAIATNIATSVLPETWKPYLWVAWPLAVLITAVSIWLTLRQSPLEDAESPVPTTIAQRNRQVMLKQVRLDWIDGVLNRSLYQEALISLGLEERPEAIIRPFDAQVQRPNQKPQPLPVGTKIIDVFDQFGGSLLILGAPGAGKTTMLLELARELLDRAEHDEKQLMPVVFNLSSWAVKRQPLAEWLVEELNTKYPIPRKVAQGWVDTEQILPLLDGLDEVAATYRTACVEAINTFHHTHKVVGMVACSRIADYKLLTTKLHLQNAVLVQPLTRQQSDEYLKGLGKPLAGVRTALRDDPNLWELIESPLWLSIVTLAYQGLSPQKLRTDTTLEERRESVLTVYIQAMFKRRSKELWYSQQQTVAWLTWLAGKMVQESQTIFLIERLQSNWLKDINTRQLYIFFNAGICSLIFGYSGWLIGKQGLGPLAVFGYVLIGIIIGTPSKIEPVERFNWSPRSGLILGSIGGIGFGIAGGLIGRLAFDPHIGQNLSFIFSSFFGLSGALIMALIGGTFNIASLVEFRKLWKLYLRIGLRAGLFFGILLGVASGLKFGMLFGLVFGLSMWFACTLIFGVGFAPTGGLRNMEAKTSTVPNQGIHHSINCAVFYGAISGLISGLFFTVINWLVIRSLNLTDNELYFWLIPASIIGLGVGINVGLLTGGVPCIKHFTLRFLLYCTGFAPLNYAHFLDYCVDRIFLRKVGGGYIFIHRLLMEHFASLTDEDIERIAGSARSQ